MTRLKLHEDGRIALPADMRARLALKPGDAVEAFLEGASIRLVAVDTGNPLPALDLSPWIGQGRSFSSPAEVDDFLARERGEWD